ncbi:transcriptional regulator, SARP family [Planomonospora sphaerica]|uniref:Transcriptional regulator, SARP family n=1 Tax=Planomonospora sphaerica TaxID=161355 RepID=A0A171CL10_9ACTN|nr:BTAD domain-containing putative transcriptional regulator [Planomonospora sphaerica]GAT66870.1 transcriptional regulator, SARP family [Planomonospora sphaerica]
MVEFRVLGPLEARTASGRILVPKRRKPRLLLAVLLLRANVPVPAAELLDALWEDSPPASARANLQSYVSELRRLLGGGVSLSGNGYLLAVDEDGYDAAVFEKLAARGRRALAAARFREAAELLSAALALWRGELLDGFSLPQSLWPDRTRLEELRRSAFEDSVSARLALGRHEEVVAELREFTGKNPLHEPVWAQLMLALYRCGRAAEAIDAYRSADAVLDEELGVAPGQELRDLHQRILREDPGLLHSPSAAVPALHAVPVPRQLPAGTADFVGRGAYLRTLDETCRADEEGTVRCALTGTGGVGKTALAVHWANGAAARFPDGQLHIDLRGFTPSARPVNPLDALSRFLRALGVPAERIPVGTDEAASLYRSLLAGKRMLVLLDNAFDGDQVRPLLPPAPSCALITSRDRLDCLVALDGVRRLSIDVMPADEARELLERITGTRHEPGAEPRDRLPSVLRLAESCGRLPLALRLAATQIVTDPRLSVSSYLTKLEQGDRLSVLDGDIGRRRVMHSAFEASYRRLPYAARRLFRALGAIPGADFTPQAAAAALGSPPGEVEPLLAALSRVCLVDTGAGDRFSLHDLLRLYALERFTEEDTGGERREAHRRLTAWYLRHARAASELICPQLVLLPIDSAPLPSFADETAALTWLDDERHNLLALADRLTGRERWLMADALRGYWYLRGHFADWLRHTTGGLTAAEQAGDLAAQAAMRGGLAELHTILAHDADALGHNTAALELSRSAGWAEYEASALGRLGTFHLGRGEPRQAAEYCLRAIESHRRLGVHRGVISNLGNLGLANVYLGNLRHAAEQLGEALRWERDRCSTMGEAIGLGNLGLVAHHMGDLSLALARLDRALALFEALGSDYGTADTLSSLAAAHNDLADPDRARLLAVRARELARAIGDGRTEVRAVTVLGTALRSGSPGEAVRLHEHALSLALTTRVRYDIAQAHIELSLSLRLLGKAPASTRHADLALNATRRAGFRRLEGRALLAAGRPDLAEPVFAEVGDRIGLAHARRDRAGRSAGGSTGAPAAHDLTDPYGGRGASGQPGARKPVWRT